MTIISKNLIYEMYLEYILAANMMDCSDAPKILFIYPFCSMLIQIWSDLYSVIYYGYCVWCLHQVPTKRCSRKTKRKKKHNKTCQYCIDSNIWFDWICIILFAMNFRCFLVRALGILALHKHIQFIVHLWTTHEWVPSHWFAMK